MEKFVLGSEKWNLTTDSVRTYIVDSGASYHIADINSLTEAEKLTIRDLDEVITLNTANGYIEATQYAYVQALELDMTVKVILLEDSPAVLSLGRLCRENNFEFRWPGGIPSPSNGPYLMRNNKVYNLFAQNDVPHITAARKSSKKATSPVEKENPKDKSELEKAQEEVQSLKKALETSKQNLDADKIVHEKLKRETQNRKAYQKAKIKKVSCKTSEHNIFTHFPKDPNCRICQLSKVQKAHCKVKK